MAVWPVIRTRGRSVVRPDADDRVARRVALERHVLERHLQRDGVDVVAGERVLADLGQVAAVEQVEDAQVEEERVVGLAGEDLPAARAAGRSAWSRSVS